MTTRSRSCFLPVHFLLVSIFLTQRANSFVTQVLQHHDVLRDSRKSASLSRRRETGLRAASVSSSTKSLKKGNLGSKDKFLDDLRLPRGLKETLLQNTKHVFSKRIWIVDNSGSMKMMDGHEILSSTELSSSGPTTRWAEVQETVSCHAQLSSMLGMPTDFRLLNPPSAGSPQQFRVGYSNMHNGGPFSLFGRHGSDFQRAERIMSRSQPAGKTPLHTAVQDIRGEVVKMLPQLQADGMKVAVVICTDGCNHDYKRIPSGSGDDKALNHTPQLNQELQEALESLQGLPVCVVIRLCTDYGQIVDFYNDLDGELGELSFLDVLDDHQAEAEQVYEHNPWLNYALILHRMREMGLQGSNSLFDLLDERPFTREEIREFCAMLFGTELLPDAWDWESFVADIDQIQRGEAMHWNPVKEEMSPWIDIENLTNQQ